jgi:nucleotide-binding universal stress UspA family protein
LKVLIAIDNSDCSKLAFDAVAKYTWPDEAEFRLITVIEPIYIQYLVGVTVVDIEPMVKLQAEITELRKAMSRFCQIIKRLMRGFRL